VVEVIHLFLYTQFATGEFDKVVTMLNNIFNVRHGKKEVKDTLFGSQNINIY
jgi:hypothetical protein